ncbi:MAG TPA: hypothetical protein K8U84_03490 [Paenalcaligenes hominis]|uniref:Uncharacterized protein n=1 Tax=Paenalcaligenes hominis TaxID=643674 RepID=A0A9D2VF57_9BURK|nr:hypothetical protein [Paenalcaligenes hominis]NJB65108.1 hypothetical protein [Paenalcaligenes hominis]GGE56591.1 hypothetical protein GCM10007278_00900 [Paenalcaligenes hominis]HJH23597.1 hypothetical protein [Paenalcaligenes hominis]
MRTFALFLVIVNLFLLAYGQGFFGVAPSELGRSPSPKPFFNHANIHIGSSQP